MWRVVTPAEHLPTVFASRHGEVRSTQKMLAQLVAHEPLSPVEFSHSVHNSIAGQASIDKVAGPVGEALIMTALGLAVAVPAVLGYNWLIRRNKDVVEKLNNFVADVHGALMSGSRIAVPVSAAAPVATAPIKR